MRTTIQAVAFSPDGGRLAVAELGVLPEDGTSASTGGSVRIWDARRRVVTRVMPPTAAASIAFSPDGKLLAAIGATRPTEIREAGSGRLVARLRTSDHSRSLAFSPDGRLVATGHYDGTAQLWSAADWKPVGAPLEGHDRRRFLSLEFSPDSNVLVTAGQDGTVALWDVASQDPIGSPLLIEADDYLAADLSADGSHLFVASAKRRGVRWSVDPAAWKQQACRVAGRELTAGEWQEALPRQPFRRVCSSG
jgi:WD40 repeat protein